MVGKKICSEDRPSNVGHPEGMSNLMPRSERDLDGSLAKRLDAGTISSDEVGSGRKILIR